MKIIKTAHGVEYRSRLNLAGDGRLVYEGGPMGGSVFVHRDGRYGHRGAWHDKFEDAAFVAIQSNHNRIEALRKQVAAYDAQRDNGGKVPV